MLLWVKEVHSTKFSLSYLELISPDQSKFLPKRRLIFNASFLLFTTGFSYYFHNSVEHLVLDRYLSTS